MNYNDYWRLFPNGWKDFCNYAPREKREQMFEELVGVKPYLYWKKEVPVYTLTKDEFKEKKKGRVEIKENLTISENYFYENNYSVWANGRFYEEIRMFENGKPIRYCTNPIDDAKNTKVKSENDSFSLFRKKFTEITGESFVRSFGTSERDIRDCVPAGIYYRQKNPLRQVVCSSIDLTSAFAFELRGRIPDSHSAIEVDGYAEPTEEYPFAFYTKSHHCAEYGVFDTRNWLMNPYFPFIVCPGRTIVKDERTILMKASKASLKETIDFFYEQKAKCEKDTKEYKEAKQVLLEIVGKMWTKKYTHAKYAHISCVVIAREIQRMLKMLKEIKEPIVQVAVDGIMYEGKAVYGIEEKVFGEFEQEFTGQKVDWYGFNRYIVENGKIRTSGFKTLEEMLTYEKTKRI